MAGIGKKIEENIQLQEFVERELSMIFELTQNDETMADAICDEMGITEDEMWWLFSQLGYDRYDMRLEQEDEE